MTFKKRTHTCGDLNISNVDETVVLNGWVSSVRDLGGIYFIDIRDRYGITQLRIVPENGEPYDVASRIGLEFVISSSGKVIARENPNRNIPTGEIEIDVSELTVLNKSAVTPFVVEEDIKASEELRFKFRYLDMRRKKISDNIVLRSRVFQTVYRYFDSEGFLVIETPILMKSTPEGARDYLVPSRIHKGKFYALPQSPQTYKQVLMVAGMDKYIQICKCFRDEDLRADRQPEFTQIDLEMSFVSESDVFNVCENMIREIWKEIKGIELESFPVMSYDEALLTYGSDKPELRIKGDMKITDVTGTVEDCGFKVFDDVVNSGGMVAGLKLEGREVTRKVIDNLTEYVKSLGMGGLAYFRFNSDGSVQSPVSKFISETVQNNIREKFDAKNGDTVFLLSGEKKRTLLALGNLRLKLGTDFMLIDESVDRFIWINDFPLFAFDDEANQIIAEHHMFTMPKGEELYKLDSEKCDIETITSIRANCYDLVCNGSEFGSGSIRIHRRDIQEKVFNILKLDKQEVEQKFGFLLKAFEYGAPPHGGFAFGFDRIVATLCGTKDIRETIAFPKTTSALSLMDGSPGSVEQKQLDDLGIVIKY
ncbi:MAG: aspartate--tRNA ligase [Ignavibacteriaceae bacterium]|nr:MAG: aspartate--tRNA ligase [Chlorobiota bacterium]MBV6398242.1 Aspartate--tRNA ligase [Ignavibacteria bacterium]MCC6886165.1 aspartate--tRNA ligase [Ignavibacteriales bacterium]MCE7952583.1 aspartate--tRNA ligase [Chlorobi bacterium CHB7]MDL1886695.1 aspartate--tRNA ligase [Ignavibacteria bacterium CHB1]MEB2329637.1 aspartate--tRNA ligase [Ignavibacteriaceae bacterium]RIK50223.1 MAG: aspartate--tRNA ligase [Ignavibacteriota bacterium]